MKRFLFIVFSVCIVQLNAQTELPYSPTDERTPPWAKMMYADNADPGQVKSAYEIFYKQNKFVKNKHTQFYKRWMRNFSRHSSVYENKSSGSANWQCIGPFDFDQDAASRSYACGAAHVYTAEQSLSNTNVLYAGTATAGLFKSTNKGANWYCLTEALGIGSIRSIEIDNLNEDIIYFEANGELYKSNNGGATWNIIGDSVFQAINLGTNDIVSHPNQNNILFLADDNGLFKSIDAGDNWTQIMTGDFLEIEFHPTNSNIVYTVQQLNNKTEFYKSTDGGNTFNLSINGWPNPATGEEQKRTEIAVTADMPNRVVALATGSANGGSGLYGIYISDDLGNTWTFRCCGQQPAGVPDTTNINLMGWSDQGTDDGGQYYYDLALDIDPNNGDKIHVGGVNHWISNDGGYTFTCPAKWSHPAKDEYVHADIHDIRYYGNDLWISCDGGLFYSNNGGDNIDKMMYGIAGTDFWGFGVGFSDGEVMLGGTYHNGTLLKDNNVYLNGWLSTDGGDNIRGFVNFGNPRLIYSDYGGKTLSGDRTISNTSFGFNMQPNASYIVGESSQLEFHPECYNTIYAGIDTSLHVSNNNGASSTALFHFDGKVTSVEVAWSNPDVIYVATWPSWWGQKKLWRSEDGGNSFTDITPTLSGQLWIPFDITVSSDDANTLWIARCSMYGDVQDAQGEEVFMSTDGGTTWTNLSTSSLDNINATNIEHQRGSIGGVYLGTRGNVYYRNNSMSDWQLYNNGLPTNAISTQLVTYYKESKLRNGTNRSAWEVALFEQSSPSAQIAADRLKIDCFDNTVQFVDHSAVTNNGTTWDWSFPGGNPNSSTIENPVVMYNTPGTYEVSLTVTDIHGTSSQTITDFITFENNIINLDIIEDFESGDMPTTNWKLPPATYSWQNLDLDFGVDCNPTRAAYVNHYYINQLASEAALQSPQIDLTNSNEPTLTFDHAYAQYNTNNIDGLRIEVTSDCGTNWTTIFNAMGDSLATVTPQGNWWTPSCGEWTSNEIDLSPFNGEIISIRFVAINDYGNSFFMDNIQIFDKNPNSIRENDLNLSIYPNPNTGNFIIQSTDNLHLFIYDLNGQLVHKQYINSGRNEVMLDLSKGVYLTEFTSNKVKMYNKIVIL